MSFIRILLNKRIAALALVCLATSAACAAASGEIVTDVIVGRNNKGPYPLSWTNIDPSSVVVIINGITLKKGEQYDIDCAKGIISFRSILLNDAIVRVSYSLIPGKSERNPGKISVPVTLSVFDRQDASLRVTGLYAQDDPKNPEAAKTVVGVGGEKKWAQSTLTSQFFVSRRKQDDRLGTEASSWDQSAFRVGSQTTLGAFTFGGSMMYAGKQFAGGSETGLGQGKRAGDLLVSFSPDSRLQASAGVRQTEDTVGAAAGTKSVIQEQNLVVAPADGTKVAVSHTSTQTTAASTGSSTSVESTAVKVNQKIGSAAAASVTASTLTSTKPGGTEKTQSQSVVVTGGALAAQVGLTQKESDAAGQAKTTDVAVQAKLGGGTQLQGRIVNAEDGDKTTFQRDVSIVSKPVEFARVEASFSQKGVNDKDDVAKAAKVELSPFAHTQLSAGVKYVENGPSAMMIRDYAASTRPAGFVSFSGSLRQRTTAGGEAPDSAAAQLSLAPTKTVTFTGGFQSNPEDNQGRIQAYRATELGMKLRFGSVGLSTGYAAKDEYAAGRLSDEGKIGLELPAFGGGTLAAGYKMSRLLDGSRTTSNTYSLGYSHALGSSLSLSLTGYYTQYLKDRALLRDKTEYSAEASVGLKF